MPPKAAQPTGALDITRYVVTPQGASPVPSGPVSASQQPDVIHTMAPPIYMEAPPIQVPYNPH